MIKYCTAIKHGNTLDTEPLLMCLWYPPTASLVAVQVRENQFSVFKVTGHKEAKILSKGCHHLF